MKVTRQDIGGELLSIITKGMYADPKDALREYVQNGVDAMANEISVKIRHDHITVTDDGRGMDKIIMRKAIRVGISDKNPKKSVGFMGIGVYSSFHLCDSLVIYSRIDNEVPHMLSFDFRSMREELDYQKEQRLKDKPSKKTMTSDTNEAETTQIDLMTLLEKYIEFKELPKSEFPKVGTTVEMTGLESNFFKTLSKDEEFSDYLEKVLPLPFSEDFKFGQQVFDKIQQTCAKHKLTFRTIKLKLDVNGDEKYLYRPYRDSDFKYGDTTALLAPKFYEMNSSSGDGFLGIAWGCLNSQRKTITNEKVRGFVIKKQGFTIGKREDVMTHFGRATYFNRYVGEFIAVHPKLYPNGPRTDFEFSGVRTTFYGKVKEVANKFNEFADNYQETEKAKSDLSDAIESYNKISTQSEFLKDNGDKLLEFFQEATLIKNNLFKKSSAGKFSSSKELTRTVEETIKGYNDLLKSIKGYLDLKKKKQKVKKAASKKKTITPITVNTKEPAAESLPELISLIGLELTEDIRAIFELIDEKFIKPSVKNKHDYAQKLSELREEIEELFESE